MKLYPDKSGVFRSSFAEASLLSIGANLDLHYIIQSAIMFTVSLSNRKFKMFDKLISSFKLSFSYVSATKLLTVFYWTVWNISYCSKSAVDISCFKVGFYCKMEMRYNEKYCTLRRNNRPIGETKRELRDIFV